MDKIYFDGCSYTFGQSLELYCNPFEIFGDNRLSKYEFTESDLEFIKKNRYSGIVSNNFGLYEINNSRNGKSNGKILFDLKNYFIEHYDFNLNISIKKENIEDYKYIIIQLTHFNRYFTNNSEWVGDPESIKFLSKTNFLTLSEMYSIIENIEKIQLDYFLELENIFKNYPNKLKIIFHSNEWEDILSKEQIEKYGISIDGEYMIRRWAEKNKMFINNQEKFKRSGGTKLDTHLCMEGHKILAESIIKQL